tara:strand:+ start:5183 stop:6073 length:891 start_codon:yes stop_codon:yes gene_type:complete
MNIEKKYQVYTFYRFIKINNKNKIKNNLDKDLKYKNIKGTILLADEGINASITGKQNDLVLIIKKIKKLLKIKTINLKINTVSCLPFNRMKVRLKKEIVSLGIKNLNIPVSHKGLVSPNNWDKLIKEKNIKLIDVRNIYETQIGNFKNSLDPQTHTFREFPTKILDLKLKNDDKIAMYCTGGIRCEKASAYLKSKGYKEVYQLEGGILNYLHYNNEKNISSWNGECFVFDGRVALNKKLEKGSYKQCYGCRSPITKKETKSKEYQKGVHCPKCINKRSDEQKKRSLMRQNQLDNLQ